MAATAEELARKAIKLVSALSYAQTPGLLVLFGAEVSASADLCAEVLRHADAVGVPTIVKKAAVGVRAILASLEREREQPPVWMALRAADTSRVSRWFKVLSTGPTPARLVMFGAHVRSIPRREAFLQICESFAPIPTHLHGVREAVDVLGNQLRLQFREPAPLNPSAVHGMRRPMLAIGMAVAIAFVSVALIRYSMYWGGWHRYATHVGKHAVARLSDGSTVELNTASSIRYREAEGVRTVVMTAGEVHFHVVHNPLRPFIVVAGDTIVRDIGTDFSIRLRGREAEVLVTDGRVEVRRQAKRGVLDSLLSTLPAPGGAGVQLEAGARLIDHDGQLTSVQMSRAEMEMHDAWRHGEIVINGMSVAEIVVELNRYSTRRIVIADPALAGRRLGGVIRVKADVRDALARLQQALPIDARANEGSANIEIRERGSAGRGDAVSKDSARSR